MQVSSNETLVGRGGYHVTKNLIRLKMSCPMAIHIGRVSLYAGTPESRHALSASRLQSLIETPTDRSLCHIFVALSDQWISTHLSLLCTINGFASIVTFRHQHTFVALSNRRISTPSLGLPMNANDYNISICFKYLASRPLFGTPTNRSLYHLRCSIQPTDINITLERLTATFQWETGDLSYRHISNTSTCHCSQADYNH